MDIPIGRCGHVRWGRAYWARDAAAATARAGAEVALCLHVRAILPGVVEDEVAQPVPAFGAVGSSVGLQQRGRAADRAL